MPALQTSLDKNYIDCFDVYCRGSLVRSGVPLWANNAAALVKIRYVATLDPGWVPARQEQAFSLG